MHAVQRSRSAGAALSLVAAVVAMVALGCSRDSVNDVETSATGSETPSAEPEAVDRSYDTADGRSDEPTESREAGAQDPGEFADTGPETLPQPVAAADSPPAAAGAPIQSTSREDVPSGLRDPDNPDHPEPLVELSEIRGVVPPDAIPALEDPAFEPVGDADWLPAVEPVLALEIDGDARAYPLRIMTWHELVNGTVGGVPVTVSYCPLCNSAVAYDRRVGERILDFGTSGALFNSALVMYDRQTESLWSHYTGQAVVGHLTGAELDLIPVQTVSFESFRAAYPDGHVLSQATGRSRQYGQNPYISYDSNSRPFLFSGDFDDRLDPIARVVALRDGDEGAVVPYEVLAERRVVAFSFAGRDLVALYEPGLASALDSPAIAEGRDVGATGVFVRSIDGRRLDLQAGAAGGFVDAATGAVYDILGQPTDVAFAALEPVEHLDTFWFAAAAYYPEAHIIGQ